jgi:hypothetical protein
MIGGLMQEDVVDTDDRYSAAEISAALDGFDDADWNRMNAIARRLSAAFGSMTADELLSDGIAAVLATRTCKRSVDPRAFLAGSMKSIASNASKKKGSSEIYFDPAMLDKPQGGDDHEWRPGDRQVAKAIVARAIADLAVDADELEQREAGVELAHRLQAELDVLFADDEEMRFLLEGVCEGLRGSELSEFVGVDAARLATLRRRLARAFDRIREREMAS